MCKYLPYRCIVRLSEVRGRAVEEDGGSLELENGVDQSISNIAAQLLDEAPIRFVFPPCNFGTKFLSSDQIYLSLLNYYIIVGYPVWMYLERMIMSVAQMSI